MARKAAAGAGVINSRTGRRDQDEAAGRKNLRDLNLLKYDVPRYV